MPGPPGRDFERKLRWLTSGRRGQRSSSRRSASKPGSRVKLAQGLRSRPSRRGVEKKREGVALLEEGVAAARPSTRRGWPRRTAGACWSCCRHRRRRQGRDDPPRDERRQPAGRLRPQLQGSLRRGARPRLPVALCAAPARARRDRDLQPLALRGGARRPGAPREPRPREAAEGIQARRRVEAALPRDQRLGAISNRQRVPDREAVPQPLQGGAADRASCDGSTCPTTTGSSPPPTSASASAGTTTRRRSRRCSRTRAPNGRRGT